MSAGGGPWRKKASAARSSETRGGGGEGHQKVHLAMTRDVRSPPERMLPACLQRPRRLPHEVSARP